jgi:hypothetical protein
LSSAACAETAKPAADANITLDKSKLRNFIVLPSKATSPYRIRSGAVVDRVQILGPAPPSRQTDGAGAPLGRAPVADGKHFPNSIVGNVAAAKRRRKRAVRICGAVPNMVNGLRNAACASR